MTTGQGKLLKNSNFILYYTKILSNQFKIDQKYVKIFKTLQTSFIVKYVKIL